MSGLELSVQRAIAEVLRHRPEVKEARLFGSRAKGTERPESDIDIALFGDLDRFAAEAIAAELDELPFPYRFDVQAFGAIQSPALKGHIDRVGTTIYRAEAAGAAEDDGE